MLHQPARSKQDQFCPQALNLARNDITRLPDLEHNWAVQGLDVSDTSIGDSQMIGLLKGATNLYALGMANTPISDLTLSSIRRGNVDIDNIRLYGTKVSVQGIKGLIDRVKPNYLVTDLLEQQRTVFDEFMKKKSILCCIIMTDGGFESGRGKTIMIGEPKHKHTIRDKAVIHAKPYELITVTADARTFGSSRKLLAE
jgi:hypothetical protein